LDKHSFYSPLKTQKQTFKNPAKLIRARAITGTKISKQTILSVEVSIGILLKWPSYFYPIPCQLKPKAKASKAIADKKAFFE